MLGGAGLCFAHAVLSEPCHRGHAVTLLTSWERATPLAQDVAQVEPGRWEPEGRLNLAWEGRSQEWGLDSVLGKKCRNPLSWERWGHGGEGTLGREKHG